MPGRSPSGPQTARADSPRLLRRFWRSVFPEGAWPHTERDRRRVVAHTLILHPRPVLVPADTIRFTHTFGLGGMSFVLFLLLAATGLLTLFVYEPSPERAYASIFGLERDILFGRLVRGVHFWSGNLLVIVMTLHVLRVFLTGAYHAPRQLNWVVGCGLLGLVLASNFTGYLLPWDQLSYWAVTISTGMLDYVPVVGAPLRRTLLGGEDVGRATLVVFHSLHTTALPILLTILMALHFWRVRKAGGVIRPVGPTVEVGGPVAFVPNLLLREAAVGLALVALVLILAVGLPPSLGMPANPGMSPNPAKAPWYFAGFQELLMHLHPVAALLVLPLVSVAALLALPYLRLDGGGGGAWFLSVGGRQTAAVGAAVGAVIAAFLVLLDATLPGPRGWVPFLSPFVARGVVPIVLAGLLLYGFVKFVRRRYSASGEETAQAVFALAFSAFVILTLTGVLFRGRGMALVAPWAR